MTGYLKLTSVSLPEDGKPSLFVYSGYYQGENKTLEFIITFGYYRSRTSLCEDGQISRFWIKSVEFGDDMQVMSIKEGMEMLGSRLSRAAEVLKKALIIDEGNLPFRFGIEKDK